MPIETKDLEPILDRVHEWTRSADTKIDILTAIEAAVVALLLGPLVGWIASSETGAWERALFIGGFAFLVAALINSLQALFPRTEPEWWRPIANWVRRVKIRPSSVTYFAHIAQLTLDDYRERLRSIDEAALREDWISQIHVSAVIAYRKHHKIKVGILLFCLGLVLIGGTYISMKSGE